jgi:hypothetical protein
MGFGAEAATVYEFPTEMFLPGSDLTPINENIDKFVYGLTSWEPSTKEKATVSPPKITVEGKDYEEAVANMNHLFLKNMWGDGMPLLPATEERVNWMLTGTDLSPDTLVGGASVLPRGGIATVESVAVALAMAGGRPEYLPVLIAAVDAVTQPEWGLQAANTTTGAPYPLVVVNGMAAKQIRLNSGYGIMGPDPRHPADATIGRALRLILQNLGGAIPGIGTMAIHGEMRYTNAVFAEDEAGLPEDWNSLSVELGFAPESNVVTVIPADDIMLIFDTDVGDEESLERCLREYAAAIASPSLMSVTTLNSEDRVTGVVLIGRGTARAFADLGWSKEQMRDTLWEYSKIPWSEAEKVMLPSQQHVAPLVESGVLKEGEDWPVSLSPEQILIVVAGGEQAGHGSYVKPGGNSGYVSVSKEVQLPSNWDELLEQAESDLGPMPLD